MSNKTLLILKISITICIVLYNMNLYGQTINTTSLLQKFIIIESQRLPYQENIHFYKNSKNSLPLFSGIGFRTATDEWDFGQQEYQLRFELNSRAKRQAMKKIVRTSHSTYSVKRDIYLLEQLHVLYNQMLTWHIAQCNKHILNMELANYEDKKIVLQKLMENENNISISRWLSNESKINDKKIDLARNESILKEVSDELRIAHEIDQDLFTDDWISIDQITEWSINETNMWFTHPDIEMNKITEEIATAQLELEQANSKKWFDFFQLEYQNNEKLERPREFSLGTSIIIPFKSMNRIKVNEAQSEILKAKEKTNSVHQKLSKDLRKLYFKLKRQINERKLILALIEEQKMEETFEDYQKIDGLSPLILLDIKEELISYKRKELSLSKDIYSTYLNILFKSGSMIKQPLTNFVSKDLHLINIAN